MNKTKTTVAIALFLMLTVAVSLVSISPNANAQTVRSWRSFIYVAASPPVIGVGQEILLFAWTADMPPDIGEQTGAVQSPSGRAGWYDITLTVTKPDNTTETIALPYTDAIGGTFHSYTPTDVGTFSFVANFPGAWKNTSTTHTYYEPATSLRAEFTVQADPIQPWKEAPLPDGFWTRPINSASRELYVLAGNWLSGAAGQWPPGAAGGTTTPFVYGLGPESAHILWTKPLWAGGLMDERFGSTGFATSHYQGVSFSPIIVNGKIFYAYRDTGHNNLGYLCADLYTGQTLYYVNATMPSFAQIYDYSSGNQHGGFPYLWRTSGVTLPDQVQVAHAVLDEAGQLPRRISAATTENSSDIIRGTVWEMLDAQTGQTVCYIANVSSRGTAVYGKDGSILRYNLVDLLDGPEVDYYLQVWNSSAGTMVISQTGTGAWQWRPQGGGFGGADPYFGSVAYNNVHDGNLMFSLNVSIPSNFVVGPRNARQNQTASIQAVREGEYIIIGNTGVNDEEGIAPGFLICLSLERGKEGTLLWQGTFTPPSSADRETVSFTGVFPEYGMFCFHSTRKLQRFGYSLETFDLVWESEPEPQMNYYSFITRVYEGKLFSASWGGVIIAYNITTGDVLWTYTAENIGFESPYGNYPINIFAICDGKLYTLTGEHSINQPMWRGPNLRCINATSGEEIWKIMNFGANGGASLGGTYVWMADGKVVGINFFDNQIYCFGKGNSATTVTASPKVSVHGTEVLIEGTVTDQTPTGRRNVNDLLDFSLKGTPAISDDNMSAWMEYMFMQQAFPADAKGVEVVLTVLDPNNNYYEVGRATSDVTGAFGYAFEPLVPGTYQITATFEGSRSYGSSFATTYITVEEAPAATAEPTPPPAPMTDTYVIGFGSAAIIAIVIGFAILILLKKR